MLLDKYKEKRHFIPLPAKWVGLKTLTGLSGLVTHYIHGTGAFGGTEVVKTLQAEAECAIVLYKSGGRLLIPLHRINTLRRAGKVKEIDSLIKETEEEGIES